MVVSQQRSKPASGQVRRSPRFAAFLLTGALSGLVIGLFLSVTGPVDARYDAFATAGFLALIFAGLGALAGGLVAILLDRRT